MENAMNDKRLLDLLQAVSSGGLAPGQALERLRALPFEDLGYAKVDLHRSLRKGYPETIFCQGKTPEQVAAIAATMNEHGVNVLGTRCDRAAFDAVEAALPRARYYDAARCFFIDNEEVAPTEGYAALVCAGTSDIPVAEEAAVACLSMGVRVERIYDVGVAGLHRLFDQRDLLVNADIAIVCAGMEGALPSVVAGIAPCLVIAVPTSVGYGAGMNGIAALLGMLNSCASGLAVVNIDNGFGAAAAACAVMRKINGRR